MAKNKLDNKYLLAIGDLTSFILSCITGFSIFYFFVDDINQYLPLNEINERITIHLLLSFIGVSWFWIRLRHYTYRKPFWFELKEILRTLAIFAIIELSTIAFSKLYLSRYLWVTIWCCTLIIVPLVRILLKKWLIKTRRYIRNTIIIGGDKNAIDAYYALKSEDYLGLEVKYFLSSHPSKELYTLGVPILKDVVDAGILGLVSDPYDQFIIALEEQESTERDYWIRYLSKHRYRSVSVIPSLRGLPLYSTDMSFLFSYDVMLLRINHNLAKRTSRFIKRTADIILSFLGLVLLSPLFVYLILKIRQDGGKAIYGHQRIGQNGRQFSCLKFRTMVINSEETLKDLLDTDPLAKEEWERDFKLKNDPRITPIGHFLRCTSLDELPQLCNVLKGEMSLVGPRPIVAEELSRYDEDVDYYFMAKPGMTGLWQVSGRNDVDYQKRVYFDSWYVKNWSLWNDLVILCKTISVVIKRSGAY
ncbi:TPA: undecaprenyl-phosphate galactose phosphotransferase WbaP [Mannheimia haemolytica]